MRISIFIVRFAILFGFCRSFKTILAPPVEISKSQATLHITLHELLKKCSYYHGKLIETEGVFHIGEEVCAVSLSKKEIESQRENGYTSFTDIWIDFISDSEVGWDSLQKHKNEMVTIKGVFDTARKGHLGGYPETITNAFFN